VSRRRWQAAEPLLGEAPQVAEHQRVHRAHYGLAA
jgi:hypothetical protein